MSTPPVVLSIAATDSGGGAGLAADLATFAALGVHGACVVTAVTAQDTTGVHAIHPVPLGVVAAQLDAVLADLPVAVVKTGVLGSAEVVRLVAERCAHLPLVVDPVLRATTGATFADETVIAAYRDHLLPVAAVVTPNVEEAAALLGQAASPRRLAAMVAERGPAAVVTGGDPESTHCVDWLAVAGEEPEPLSQVAIRTRNDHGTGCTLSAGLAAHLAHDLAPPGVPGSPPKSIATPLSPRRVITAERLRWTHRHAARFTATQLLRSADWELGRGRGPIAHLIPTSPTSTSPITENGDPR